MSDARIAIVSGIRIRHDAISNIICWQRQVLADAGYQVDVLVHHHDDDNPWESTSRSSWELLRNPSYAEADLVILHFGIYYELFNVLTLPHPRNSVRIVHFHNITPPELLDGETRRSAQVGIVQLPIAESADIVWSDSTHNTEMIEQFTTIDRRSVVAMPPSVPDVNHVPHADATTSGAVRLIAIGRFIPAKGLSDFIAALSLLPHDVREHLHVTLAGSAATSDSAYMKVLDDEISVLGLDPIVERVFDAPEDRLVKLLWEADLFVSASHHEGFCVPAVEALAAGCRAIVTDVGALPETIGGCGRVVAAHDAEALAEAIHAEVIDVHRCRSGEPTAIAAEAMRRERVDRHIRQFTEDACRERLLTATQAALVLARRQ